MWDMSFCYNSLMRLISATHAHVRADEKNDADSLFVDVKNDLQHTTCTVDNALLGQEHPENLVSTDSFDPLLCRLGLEQLSYEMACKSLCAEIAHETTISMLNELSSFSLEANAVLALEAFPLNCKYFLAPAQFHSSRQDVESVEIPKHVPATSLKHLHLQKYKEKIIELNKMINYLLDFSESVFELKKLCTNDYIKDEPNSYAMDNISLGVYWIIITVVACTTQMCCLTSKKDKTQDLSRLAKRISEKLSNLKKKSIIPFIHREQYRIEKNKAERKMKELLQAPNEIVEVIKGLIFSKDDKQSLFDGFTKEMVSVDVLKKKYVLLFISSLNISNDDINTFINLVKKVPEQFSFEVVWIPIVEQWTEDLVKKFEDLRSKLPCYIVEYFSPIAGIKFIKEEWHYDSKPIVVWLNSKGDVKEKETLARHWAVPYSWFMRLSGGWLFNNPRGPHQNKTCTFYCGGKEKGWVKQFSEKFNVVAKNPLIVEDEKIFITLILVGKDCKLQDLDEDIQELLRPFKNERRWAVFINGSKEVICNQGTTILTFLERFEQWKENLRGGRRIETCFKDLLRTGSLP